RHGHRGRRGRGLPDPGPVECRAASRGNPPPRNGLEGSRRLRDRRLPPGLRLQRLPPELGRRDRREARLWPRHHPASPPGRAVQDARLSRPSRVNLLARTTTRPMTGGTTVTATNRTARPAAFDPDALPALRTLVLNGFKILDPEGHDVSGVVLDITGNSR